MLKCFVLALVSGLVFAGSLRADDSTVFKKGDVISASVINAVVQSLRDRCADLETAVDFVNKTDDRQAFKIQELERKVEGMQKQITILHAKKEDK